MADTLGRGTLVAYGDWNDGYTSPYSASYTQLAKVESVDLPDIDVEETEGRYMTSPDGYNEPVATWKAPGEGSVTVRFAKAEYASLLAMQGDNKAWQVTTADGSKYEFVAFLKGLKLTTPIDGLVNVEFALRSSGKPAFTPAA